MSIISILLAASLGASSELALSVDPNKSGESATQLPSETVESKSIDLECTCTEDVSIGAPGKVVVDLATDRCGALEVKVETIVEGMEFTAQATKALIGHPIFLKWASCSRHHLSTTEGRTMSPIMATIGGDLNEWVMAIAIYEAVTPVRIIQAEMDRMFKAFLEVTGHLSFYYNTDRAAQNAIAVLLGREKIDLSDSKRLSLEEQMRLLKLLTQPEYIGSLHFKSLKENPDAYGIERPLIIDMAIRTYFKFLWEGHPKLRFVVLGGKHEEKATLLINVSPPCAERLVAPLVAPRNPSWDVNSAVHILHKQAPNAIRIELGNYFASLDANIDNVDFTSKLHSLGNIQLEGFKKYQMRPSTPMFEVTFY